MNGKKTYLFLGALGANLLASYAGRHGYDLGPFTPDVTEALAGLCAAGAAWARSVAQPQVTVTDSQGKASEGPVF